MATFELPAPLKTGNNKLVRGTSRKSFNSNKRLIAKLIFSEIISNFNPLMAALPAIYNTLGTERFIAALQTAVNIPLRIAGFPGFTEEEMTSVVNELGGPDKVAQALEEIDSGFQAPNLGYLYTFAQDELNIPSGEYTEGSVWRSDGQTYILQPSREWIQSVDWIAGVPNLSWLGDWFLYDSTTDSFNPFDPLVPEEPNYTPIPKTDSAGNNNGDEETAAKNFLPLLGGALGFLLGGPIGLPIGFIAGNFLGKK